MTRKFVAVVIGVFLVLALGAAGPALASESEVNPIDAAFTYDFQAAQNSVEINYLIALSQEQPDAAKYPICIMARVRN